MPRFSRQINTKSLKRVVRIYTEGKKTEPNYFGSIKDELRLPEIDIKVYGIGDHTLSLVDYVIKEKESDSEDTEWWVVFDRDDHDHFNHSIEKAEAQGIHVAYSNECFELWFILHFEFLNTSLGRDKFEPKLTSLLGVRYEKSMDVYAFVKDKESIAIRNAKRLEKDHDTQSTTSYVDRDPSTTVYKLVEALRMLKNNS